MAQKTQIILVDDLDGGQAVETVTFGLDGVTYEIDLNEEHAAQLRDAFASWIGHGRKVARSTGGRTTRRSSSSRGSSDATEIREWARSQGIQVSDRGRIPANIKEQYEASK